MNMNYSSSIDWQINCGVRQEMVRRRVDLANIQISSVRGIVQISGDLKFADYTIEKMDVMEVFNRMRTLDRCLRGIGMVRDVQWRFQNWLKTGSHWSPARTRRATQIKVEAPAAD